MTEFTIGVNTIPGIADSDYLDRLADLVYAIDGFIDPLLGLNDDGGVMIEWCINAETLQEAVDISLPLLADAIAAAAPLRLPTEAEVEHGVRTARDAVGSLSVSRSEDREAVYA